MRGSRLGALVSLLPCDAALRAWDDWDQHFAVMVRLFEETGYIEADCPRCLGLAGRLAADAGEPWRARQALLLAAKQCWELGLRDEARSHRDALRALTQSA